MCGGLAGEIATDRERDTRSIRAEKYRKAALQCICASVRTFSNALSGLTVPFSPDSLQTCYYSNAELLPTLKSRFIRIPGLRDESKSNT